MRRILIIDDEKNVRDGLAHFVSTLDGFTVCGTASNGAEALCLCVRLKPDIILTDINMPTVDGLTFISRLKDRAENAAIIVISGYDYFSYAQRALRLGVRDYLLKPVDRAELDRLLNEISNGMVAGTKTKCAAGNDPVDACMEVIRRRYNEPELNISACAHELFLSPGYLRTLFKRRTGVTFVHYLTDFRIAKSKELLATTDMYIRDVAAAVSFEDERYFSSLFHRRVGCTPSEYRTKNSHQ